MSVGIFTGTIKSIDRKTTQEGDFTCTVWLNIADFKEQPLRATAWNEVARSMDVFREGDTVTVSGTIDIEPFERPGVKKKILTMPTILQVAALNQVVLAGRAGAAPKVQRFDATDTRDATILATFNLAVKSRRDDPNWFPLEIWGKTAEIVEQYVQKGSSIQVIGTIGISGWQDRQTGEDRAKPVVRVDRVYLLGSKREETEESAPTDPLTQSSDSDSISTTSETSEESEEPQPKRRKSVTSGKRKKQSESQPEATELLTQA